MRLLKKTGARLKSRIFGEGWRHYWVVYYVSYIGGVVYWGMPHWDGFEWRDIRAGSESIPSLVDVYGMAAGSAILIAISVEVAGRMVLLIPPAIKALKAKGAAEHKRRVRDIVAKYGREVDGNLVLPLTDEVRRKLLGESDDTE